MNGGADGIPVYLEKWSMWGYRELDTTGHFLDRPKTPCYPEKSNCLRVFNPWFYEPKKVLKMSHVHVQFFFWNWTSAKKTGHFDFTSDFRENFTGPKVPV